MNRYFWRTHSHQEIDYIEEFGGRLKAFEFKWKARKVKPPQVFMEHYLEVNPAGESG